MNGLTMETVARRLESLERQARRMKLVGAIFVGATAALLLMGQAVPKSRVVEAEQFILKDAGGNRRAELGLQDGFAGLYVYDENKLLRARLRVSAGGSDLRFFRSDLKDAAFLLGSEQGGALVLSDTRGGAVAESVMLIGGDSPSLSLFAKNKGLAFLQVAENGTPMLQISGRENSSVVLKVLENGSPGMQFTGRDKSFARLEVLGGSRPSLTLSDEYGKTRAVLGNTELEATRTGTVEQRPASSLVLFDKDGKVLWSVP